jgi:RNA polymerase sigma-70 factor (ECF subfamily)
MSGHLDLVDDLALVARAQGGDRHAMDALLRRHADRIHAVCRRVTGNEADAADAAQDAMIAIVRGLPRFDGRSSFSTWAYRVASNASLDELRRRRRRPVLAAPDHDHVERPSDLAVVDPNAQAGFESIEERDALDAALRALPEEFRVPLVMRDVGDLDYAEIAESLGIPLGTVKSRIARGRTALAAIVRAGNQPDPGERPTSSDTDPSDRRPAVQPPTNTR